MLSSESNHKTPLFTVLLLLLTSLSPLALGGTSEGLEFREEPTIFVPGLPSLICEDGEACPTPDRGVGPWLSYSPDRDHNGMDDRLQRILDGEYESVLDVLEVQLAKRNKPDLFYNYGPLFIDLFKL